MAAGALFDQRNGMRTNSSPRYRRTRAELDHRAVDVKPLILYATGRILFGVAALGVPGTVGRILAGDGGAAPDAQAFLRGMVGREIGLGLGLLAMIRANGPVKPWLVAALLADSSDIAGIADAWRHMAPSKRLLGLGTAGGAAAIGAIVLATLPRET
jgi:hypothetical protein